MYRNPTNRKNSFRNISLLTEDNFDIVPENTFIWDGELPFKEGDTFPTDFIRERANLFKTNEALYKCEAYDQIFDTIVNFNDYMRDAVTNYPILRVIPTLPDFRMVTDTWVDLLSAKSPKIDGPDTSKITQVSTLLGASNFAVAFQSAVRGALVLYGNAVFRIDRQRGGNPKIVEMPIKNWIPFVNENDITTIDVNCFFNIFCPKRGYEVVEGVVATGKDWFCEFILYHEDGKIEKYTFRYLKDSCKLGELLDRVESQAFNGLGVSPIVVFTGQRIGNTVYGEEQFKKWEASIVSSMKAFETILVLLERTKEIYRVLPEGATQRDENTGVTFMQQTGAIMYRVTQDGKAPEVKSVTPSVLMDEAIQAYKETVVRVSRDTDLSYTLFDTKELGHQMTGKALKTAMYRTELKAKSLSTLIQNSAKMLVVKLALAGGIEIDMSDFTLTAESGFVNDIETVTEIVQKRNGGAKTLSLEDSIAILDDVTMAEAQARARQLRGEPPVEQPSVSNTDSGEGSVVSDVNLTHSSTVDINPPSGGKGEPVRFYPLGGANINGKT